MHVKRGRPVTARGVDAYFSIVALADGPKKYECRRCGKTLSQSGAYKHISQILEKRCQPAPPSMPSDREFEVGRELGSHNVSDMLQHDESLGLLGDDDAVAQHAAEFELGV